MPNFNDLEIESSIMVNIEDSAANIEMFCSNYLLPPPSGIYSNTQIEPVMVDGGDYYTLTKKGDSYTRTPVSDLNKIKKTQTVYTNVGHKDVVVVTAMQLSNKEKCLSTLPIRPYRGAKILNIMLNGQINNFIKYRKGSRDTTPLIQSHFRENLTEDELECAMGAVREQYSDTHQIIREFMGRYDWNIYFVKIKGYNITVQRSIDWRAYDWMCRMESKEWT